ncbi:Smg protein [Methylobacillus rhizosphaerae]|uniref:Protein Smg homolog n=1 Tax=Methylobacillus rhizosphaerae TaxID=551994 RepID=A0A238Z769_9PROT|nr:DUF494 domain-containing protein [Methylobacillus rhizosphaerae]SNR78992.1 Smg protein [Methylobacillus rhizosphaerae]
MFEVLVYMFENYFESDIHPDHDTLSKELFAAGFDQDDINGAVDWYNVLEAMADAGVSHAGHCGFRIYSEAEINKINTDSLSFMMFLEQAKVLTSAQRELVIDRAMALSQTEIGLDEVRWITLMVLWNQDRASDYLFVEDAMFNDNRSTLH